MIWAVAVLGVTVTMKAAHAVASEGAPIRVGAMPDRRHLGAAQEEAARQAYEETARLFEAGKLEQALGAANASYVLLPNAATSRVRAAILEELGRHCKAFDALRIGLDLDPTPEERAGMGQDLTRTSLRCAPPMGWIQLDVSPSTAAARIGNEEVPAGRTVGVTAGRHAMRLEAEGHETQTILLEVRPGEGSTVRVALARKVPEAPKPVLTPPAPATTEAAEVDDATPVLPWALVGGGGAAVVAGLVLHVTALDAAGDAESYSRRVEGESAEEQDSRVARYQDAADGARWRRAGSVAAYGVGVAAAAAGVILLLTDAASDAGVTATGAVGRHGSGVVFGWSW